MVLARLAQTGVFLSLRYLPFQDCAQTDNIIIDGEGNDRTRLTLSHWPGNATPVEYKAGGDLSAQLVFNYIDADEDAKYGSCHAVSNNHFDEDGLVGIFSMLNRDYALQNRDLLIDIARAGDFGTFVDRRAAKISFVLNAWTHPQLSPLNYEIFKLPHQKLTAILYEELLWRFPKIIQKLDSLVAYWKDEDEFLTQTLEAISDGRVRISSSANSAGDRSYCLVEIDEGVIAVDRPRAASWISSLIHPMAIHNATDDMAVLVRQGNRYEFYYRYETWVDYQSRKLIARSDLEPMVGRLSALEAKYSGSRTPAVWTYNGNDALIARLRMDGRQTSKIPFDEFERLLGIFLSR